MTDRPRGFAAQGFGFAFAVIAFAALGVSSQANAAPAKPAVTSRSGVSVAKMFGATLHSSRATRRDGIDIDPIDPNVRHFWPYLADPTDVAARAKP